MKAWRCAGPFVTMPRLGLVGIGMALGLLMGCSKSTENQLLEVGRCMKAGLLLEDRQLVAAASRRLDQVVSSIPDSGGSKALYAARINEQIGEELGLHRGRGQAMATLVEWSESSTCQAMVSEAKKAGR